MIIKERKNHPFNHEVVDSTLYYNNETSQKKLIAEVGEVNIAQISIVLLDDFLKVTVSRRGMID